MPNLSWINLFLAESECYNLTAFNSCLAAAQSKGYRHAKFQFNPILNFSYLGCLVGCNVLCHSVTWMNISELDEYFRTKPFVNDT